MRIIFPFFRIHIYIFTEAVGCLSIYEILRESAI